MGPTREARPDPFEILTAEHDLLRRQLGRALEAPAGAAQDPIAAFLASLRLHMTREEDVLYPVCERIFGGREGATAVMRDDHAAVLADVESLRTCRDGTDRRACLSLLLAHLEPHFTKEERVLYPFLAARVTNAEAASLVRRMRASGNESI